MKDRTELLATRFVKYPQYYVRGKSVTPEQAMDIIMRTEEFWAQEESRRNSPEMANKFLAHYGIFDVSNAEHDYIECHSAGPDAHGWCQLDGTISGRMYGHSVTEMMELYIPWRYIAAQFPFLEAEVLITNFESGQEDPSDPEQKGVVLLLVRDGKVEVKDPTGVDWVAFIPKTCEQVPVFKGKEHLIDQWFKANFRDVEYVANAEELLLEYTQKLLNDLKEGVKVSDVTLNWKDLRIELSYNWKPDFRVAGEIAQDVERYAATLGLWDFNVWS